MRRVESFDNLVQCQVRAGLGEFYSLHLKFHSDGRAAQWMDCTCRDNRRRGVKCAHLAALCLHLDLEESELLAKFQLSSGGSERLLYQSSAALDGESEHPAHLGALATQSAADSGSLVFGSRHTVDVSRVEKVSHARDPGALNVSLKQEDGRVLKYRLGVDDSLTLMQKSEITGVMSTRLSEEVTRGVKAVRAFSVTRWRKKKYQILKAIVFQESGVELVMKWQDLPEICRGRLGVYHRKFGFVRWADSFDEEQKRRWDSYPDQAELESHEVAGLFESDFAQLRRTAEVRVGSELQGLKIQASATLGRVQVHNTGDDHFLLDAHLVAGESESQPDVVILETAGEIGHIGSRPAPRLSLFDVISARLSGQKYVEIEGGWIKLGEEFDLVKDKLDKSGKIRLSKLDLIRFRETLARQTEFQGMDAVSRRLCDGLRSFKDMKCPDLSRSHLHLRPYQFEGYRWLWWLYENQLGGLLADEMGLGKTHQAMALLYGVLSSDKRSAPPSLVVCPTSVIDHWQDKISEFLPECRVLSFYGAGRKLSGLEKPGTIVVTSYGVLLRDHQVLSQIQWAVVVLDEAHLVKNQATRTYHSACRLRSSMRLCLTGTPLENELGELKTLFDFILPGYLGGDAAFRKKYAHQDRQADPLVSLELRRLIHPFKLRRAKVDVLEHLPEKVEDIRHCQLTPGQKRLYDQALQMKAQSVIESLSESEANIPYMHVFAVLTLLKQICNDPALVHPDYEGIPSGKLELLDELIREALESNQKVVVFSQFATMVERLSRRLTRQGIGHVCLTGQSTNRGAIIRQFQQDPGTHIFLGSLLAGGTGIDLTAASVVIHFDRWWNAAKENQATDRIHRIGQQRNVQVFKLVTRGTLEEHIDAIIERKRRTFERYVEQDLSVEGGLTREDLLRLLAPRQVGASLGDSHPQNAESP